MSSSASLLDPPSTSAAESPVSELKSVAILHVLTPIQTLLRRKLDTPKTFSGLPRPYSSFQHSGIHRIRLPGTAVKLFRVY